MHQHSRLALSSASQGAPRTCPFNVATSYFRPFFHQRAHLAARRKPAARPHRSRNLSPPSGQNWPPAARPHRSRNLSQPSGQNWPPAARPHRSRNLSPPSGQNWPPAARPHRSRNLSQPSGQNWPSAACPHRSRNLFGIPRRQPGLQQRTPAAAGTCWGSPVDNLAVSSAPPPRANLSEVEIVYTISKLYIQFQNCIYTI